MKKIAKILSNMAFIVAILGVLAYFANTLVIATIGSGNKFTFVVSIGIGASFVLSIILGVAALGALKESPVKS